MGIVISEGNPKGTKTTEKRSERERERVVRGINFLLNPIACIETHCIEEITEGVRKAFFRFYNVLDCKKNSMLKNQCIIKLSYVQKLENE